MLVSEESTMQGRYMMMEDVYKRQVLIDLKILFWLYNGQISNIWKNAYV